MAKSSLEIYNIHRVISSLALERIIRPHFADERYIQKFTSQGFIKNSTGSVIFGIEMNIHHQIKQLSQEFYLRLNDKEIQAWADLYSILLTPHDVNIREECLRVVSLYEICFEPLYMFFMHWVKIQYNFLSRDKQSALDMINSKLDMFSLTCSTPIPQYMRDLIIEYVLKQAEKMVKSEKPVNIQPCNMLFHIEEFSHPDQLDHVMPHVLSGIFIKRHLKPTITTTKITEETPSIPLLMCLMVKDKENTVCPMREIDFNGIEIPINEYRMACCSVIPSIIRLIARHQQEETGESTGQIIANMLPYTPYIGFLSDFSAVCTYGFDFSFSVENGLPVMNYRPFPLHPDDECDDWAGIVQNLAVNVYESLLLNVERPNEKGYLNYKNMKAEHVREITLVNIRKFCRVFNQPLDAEAVYDRAVAVLEDRNPVFVQA